jgi:hypothetical protein
MKDESEKTLRDFRLPLGLIHPSAFLLHPFGREGRSHVAARARNELLDPSAPREIARKFTSHPALFSSRQR